MSRAAVAEGGGGGRAAEVAPQTQSLGWASEEPQKKARTHRETGAHTETRMNYCSCRAGGAPSRVGEKSLNGR